MFKEYFILFLLAHVLGDFYVQTPRLAKKKEKSMKWVLIHCLYYLGAMLLVMLPVISWEIVSGAVLAAILHCFIDILKFTYMSYKDRQKKVTQILERNVFFIDQLLHGTLLAGISCWFVQNNVKFHKSEILVNFFNIVGIPEVQTLTWILALLIIHKPANIAISRLLVIYKPENKDENEDKKQDTNAGRFIGTVERAIIIIFLFLEQYAAIGLVLTAKSIARYDKISKEKDFAEYYLLGTLISTLIAIVVSLLFS